MASSGIDYIRSQVPWMRDLSDEEVLTKTAEITGKSLPDTAAYIGYQTPKSMMGKEFSAGWESYKGGFGHIGSAMGIPGAAEYAKRTGDRADVLRGLSTAPHSWEEMQFGDPEKGFLPYAGQLFAGSAPYMAEAAGYTLADVATGGALTPAIAARYLARPAMAGVPRVLGGQGLKEGADFAARRAAVAAAEKAGPGLARTAMLPVVTYPSSLGDTLSNQFEESGRYNLPQAMAAAVPYSALNVLGLEGAITRGAIPRLGLKGLEKNMAGRAVSGVVGSGLQEGVAEFGQEVANQYARMGVNPNATLTDPAALARYKESAIGGAILGGIPGSLHAFGGRKPLDTKQPADLTKRLPETDEQQIARAWGIEGGLGIRTPEQQAAFVQQQAEADLMRGLNPGAVPAAPQYSADATGEMERAAGVAPGTFSPVVTAPAKAAPKPKAAANAARDAKTAAAAPVDPKIALISSIKDQLVEAHNEAMPKPEGTPVWKARNQITGWVGNPESMDEAIAKLKAKITEKLTRGTGKGSEADRHKAAEPMIRLHNQLTGLPEAQHKTVQEWQDEHDLAVEAQKAADVAAKAKVGEAGKAPGAVTTITPGAITPTVTPAVTPTITPAAPATTTTHAAAVSHKSDGRVVTTYPVVHIDGTPGTMEITRGPDGAVRDVYVAYAGGTHQGSASGTDQEIVNGGFSPTWKGAGPHAKADLTHKPRTPAADTSVNVPPSMEGKVLPRKKGETRAAWAARNRAAAAAPAVPAKPSKTASDAEVAAYKLAMAPRITAGIKDEDLHALLQTQGKESVTGEEGLQVSMPSPELVTKLQKTPEGRKKLAELVDKIGQEAELGAGEVAGPKAGRLRGVAHTLGIRHSTLQGMVNRALKQAIENGAEVGLDETAVREILGLQSELDAIESGVRGTGTGGTYEGGQRVNVDEREEGVTSMREERAAETTTEEGPAEEAPAAEEAEAPPAPAKGEDTVEIDTPVEGKAPIKFASGKVDHLGIPLKLEDSELAQQEWEEGRGDEDPAWEDLPDVLQSAWIKGFVAAQDVARAKYGKPKDAQQYAIEFMTQLGLRRKAIREGVEEYGLRKPDSEAEAGEDVAAGEDAGRQHLGGVSERVPGDGAKAAATVGKDEGEAGAKPQEPATSGAEAAEPVVRRKRKVAGGKAVAVSTPEAEEGASAGDIHKLADEKNIPWDDDPAFMAWSKEVTGKERLDDMTGPERQKLYEALQQREAAPAAAKEEPKFTKFVQSAFRDTFTGEVFPTGPIHDRKKLPAAQQAKPVAVSEAGFMGDDGKFYTRDEAAKKLNQIELVAPLTGEVHSSNLFKKAAKRPKAPPTKKAEAAPAAPAPAVEEAAAPAEPKPKKARKKAEPKPKAAPAVSDAAVRTLRLNRARKAWLSAFEREPAVGRWDDLSAESQEEFLMANDDEQALADVISIKLGDPSAGSLAKVLAEKKKEQEAIKTGTKPEPVSAEERARTKWGELHGAAAAIGPWDDLTSGGQQEFAALAAKEQNVAGAVKVKQKDNRWKEISGAPKAKEEEAAPAQPAATQEQLETGVGKLSDPEKQKLADAYGTKVGSKKFFERLAADVAKATNEGIDKVAKAIRAIVAKVAAAVLAIGIVFNPMVFDQNKAQAHAFAYDLPAAITTSVTTTKEIKAEVPAEARTKMSALAQRVYEAVAPGIIARAGMETARGFIIADKPEGMLHAFHADGSLMVQAPSLYSKDKADALIAGSDPFKGGKKITPAGTFTLQAHPDPEYTGGMAFRLLETKDPSGYIAVHAVWLGEPKEQRQQRLDSPSPADNRISYGCINTTNEAFLNVLMPNSAELSGGAIFVLPDETAKTGEMFPAKTETTTTTTTSQPGNVTAASETQPKDTPDRNRATQRVQRVAAKRREKLLPWAKKKWGERVAPNGRKIVDNFLAWFDESVVVDADGNPQIYFHGTTAEFDAFKRGWEAKIATAMGFHFAADPKVAGNITNRFRWIEGHKEGANTLPVYIKIQNPLVITGEGQDDTEVAKAVLRHSLTPEYLYHMLRAGGHNATLSLAETMMGRWAEGKTNFVGQRHFTKNEYIEAYAHASLTNYAVDQVGRDAMRAVRDVIDMFVRTSGYDGVVYTNTSPIETEGAANKTTYIAFHPEQVKSASGNNGNFDQKQPSIRGARKDERTFAVSTAAIIGEYEDLLDQHSDKEQAKRISDAIGDWYKSLRTGTYEGTMSQYMEENLSPDDNAVYLYLQSQNQNYQQYISTRKTPTTAARLREVLVEALGGGRAFDRRVTVVQGPYEVPWKWMKTATESQGFVTTKDGHVYLIADHLPKGNEFGVFMHELGVHTGMERLIGRDNMYFLAGQIQRWADKDDDSLEHKIAALSQSRVEAAEDAVAEEQADEYEKEVAPEYEATDDVEGYVKAVENYEPWGWSGWTRTHEDIAYFVDAAINDFGIKPTAMMESNTELGRWFRKFWKSIIETLNRLGWTTDDSHRTKLTAQDIVDLAWGAANLDMGRIRERNEDEKTKWEQEYNWRHDVGATRNRTRFAERTGPKTKTGTTAAHARRELKKLFHSNSRFDQRITIVDDVNEIPPDIQARAQATETTMAFVLNDENGIPHAYIIAGNVAKGDELSVFLHEIGVHMGLENLIGRQNRDRLAGQVDKWSKLNDGSIESTIAKRVAKRVATATELAQKRGEVLTAEALRDETVAYFVEEAVKAGINPMALDAKTPLGRWFRTLWAAVKSALRKMGLDRFDQLTAQDFVDLAYGAARLELEGTWHGTAADYRRFSHKFMSTGEGGQAFAWGTYLAQAKAVGHQYWMDDTLRKGSGRSRTFPTYEGKEITDEEAKADPIQNARYRAGWHKAGSGENPEEFYQKLIDEAKEDLKRTDLSDRTRAFVEEWLDFHEKALAAYKKVDHDKVDTKYVRAGPEGQLLRTDVNAEEHELLDWDKRFADQPQFIKDAMEKAWSWVDPKKKGEDIYRERQRVLGSKKAASEELAKMGIKGIRFFDQFSRDRQDVDYTGPDDAHVATIHAGMERGLTFGEAKDRAVAHAWQEIRQHPKNSPEWKAGQERLKRVNASQEEHYKMSSTRTRNLVIFDDKNIQRVFSHIGANAKKVRYSHAATAGAMPAVRAEGTKRLTNLKSFAKRHGLGFMITEDIADLAESNGFDEVRTYVNAAKTREGDRVRFEQPVGKIADQYDALPQAERGTGPNSVNRFIHEATMRGDLTGIGKFSAAGQKLIKDVFKHGRDTLALKKQLIEQEIGKEYDKRIAEETEDAEKDKLRKEKALALKRYSKLMTVKSSDTYAPLKRFGDYVVSGKSAEYLLHEAADTEADVKWLRDNEGDPNHYQVHFAESQGEADALADTLRSTFVGGELYAAARDADIHGHRDLFRAFPVLLTRLRAEFPMEGGKVSPMERIIRDLFLQALAENHARKVEMRRRSITGASHDMLRAFVTQGRADASFLASLKHNDALENAVQGMREGAKRDRTQFRPYLNEMLQRHAASYETQSADWANKIKRLTSIWMLATNPTYYLQQLVQVMSMSLPVIAGRHQYWRSVRALQRGYSDMMPLIKGTNLTGIIDWSTAPADVRDMLNTLSNNGAIDVTNTMDQGEWETAGKSAAGATWNRIDRKLRGMNTRVEALNRSVTATGAYRLELARNGGDKAAATQYAEQMVRQTHGSYDGSNTPRYLQGTYKGLLTQFRRFQIVQISLIARLFHNAFKGDSAKEKAIAKRALTYTLLHTLAIGGTLGMPGAMTIASIVARLFGPSDEPPDFEKWAREAIDDQLVADLLLKGVPAMLGINMSDKFAMGQMLAINPFAPFPHDRASAEKYVSGSLGPSVGLAYKAIDGLDLLYRGDISKGAEQLLPSGFSNAMKGYRIGTEGISLRRGDVVLGPEEIGLFDATMQGLGLPTMPITRQRQLSQTKFAFDTYYKDRTEELIRDYQQARKEGESTGDIMQDWRDMQEARVRNGYARQPLSTLIKSAQQQRKRERDTAGGVEFVKANKQFVQRQANL